MFEKLFKSVEEVDAHADRCLRRTNLKSARYPHYYEFADLYYKLGAYSKALAYLRVLVKNGITSVRVLSLYGDCLSQLGRSKEGGEFGKERSFSQSIIDDCPPLSDCPPVCNSISEPDTFFDASDVDAETKLCSFSLENSLIDAVKAIDIGDEKACNPLGSAEPNATQLEQLGQPSSHLMLFLVYLIRDDLRRKQAKKTLSYLKRLLQQINIAENRIDAKIIVEAKLNLAMSLALYVLASTEDLTKQKLEWCAKTLRRLRMRPEVVDRLWKPVAEERYMFCSLYSAYLESHCSLDEPETAEQTFCDGTLGEDHLVDCVEKIGSRSDGHDFTARDLADYIERNSNKIDAIVWLCYCYWLNADGSISPSELNFARDKCANHWLDRYCFLFGLVHMLKQSCDQWFIRDMSTVVLMPYLTCSSFEYSERYIEAWWLLSSRRLVRKQDEQRLSRLSTLLRMDSEQSSTTEMICPSALLSIATCLHRLAAKQEEGGGERAEMLERSEHYLSTLLLPGYIEATQQLSRAKLWFACDAPPMDKRAFRYAVENELADLLSLRRDYHRAISVLSASGNRSIERNVKLLQLLLRDPDTYRERASKLCRQILETLRNDEHHSDYQVVFDAVKSLETGHHHERRETVGDDSIAIRPVMTTLLEMVPSIQCLQATMLRIKQTCLPQLRAIGLQRLLMANQVRLLTSDITAFQGSIRQQRQMLVDWHASEGNKPHELQAIDKASRAAESALEALNERMANLRLM